MHAASRHGTPSLTSLPKDGGVSCIGHSSGRSPIQFFDHTQPCLCVMPRREAYLSTWFHRILKIVRKKMRRVLLFLWHACKRRLEKKYYHSSAPRKDVPYSPTESSSMR